VTPTLRKFVVLLMCAGILLPVLSSQDDVALLSPVLREFASRSAGNLVEKPSHGDGAPDVSFWILFDVLQCPALFHFSPHMNFAGTVIESEPVLHSSSSPRPAGRSPPANS
jgi:hypothetical protein